ncbi:MAG TPA: CHAD domain-containing protein [Rubrobacter sp.]|jgi:triphosphatase|nr:CHAD domain-containing protein [Rubrobacter sp.]
MKEQVLDHEEIEWQLEAVDLALVENWLKEHPSAAEVAVVPGGARELNDVYYDTEDWRFYRAGYRMRVRRDGESAQATMKALDSAEGALRRRREISEPIDGIKSPKGLSGPVGERVRRLAGTADLRPLFEVRTRRRTFVLRTETPSSGEIVEDGSGNIRQQNSEQDAIVAEIALDESEIFANGGGSTHLSRVEVEVGSDAHIHDGVGDFVEVLKESLKLRPTLISKFRTGLSVSGLSPEVAPDLGPTKIDATLSAGQVAFAILRRHFGEMLAHEPGVRLGEDPEELHDMRVATRRLRAALKLYSDVLPKRAERYERDLRWVAGALGEVRDLDVHLEGLSEEASSDGEVLEEIAALLRERRVQARRGMLEALDSNRYERLIASFSATLRRGRSPSPTDPILEAAPHLLRERYKKVRKSANRLSEDSPPEHYHDLRKKGKRLRYALEPLQEIYGKQAKKMVKLLKKTQDDLGDHQDLIVASGLMEELGVAGDRPPQVAFSMGTLSEGYGREASEIRAGFVGSKSLRTLKDGKQWKKLRKKLEKRAGG